jgi:hypothetical protein
MPMTETRETRAFVQEMKFLIAPEQAAAIREWARARMAADPNAGGDGGDQYRVTSLYLDTEDLAVYERRGSYGRSKFRVRRYGESEWIYLERKLKTRNRVGKQRSFVPAAEVAWLASETTGKGWAGHWFHERVLLRELRPVCQISYLRTARMAMSGTGPVRLTLDEDVTATPVDGYAFVPAEGGTVLTPERRILELKYRLEVPGLFKELMQEFGLSPQPSSKYRMAVEGLELRKEVLCLSS